MDNLLLNSHESNAITNTVLGILSQQADYNLVSMLKPKILQEGNQWMVLHGDNIQDGICGFGDTVYKAVMDFNQQFVNPIK